MFALLELRIGLAHEQLRAVREGLQVEGAESLMDINALSGLTTVEGDLGITGSESLSP